MRTLAMILLACLPLQAADNHPTYVRPHANNKAQIVQGHPRKPVDPNKLESRQPQKPRTSKSTKKH